MSGDRRARAFSGAGLRLKRRIASRRGLCGESAHVLPLADDLFDQYCDISAICALLGPPPSGVDPLSQHHPSIRTEATVLLRSQLRTALAIVAIHCSPRPTSFRPTPKPAPSIRARTGGSSFARSRSTRNRRTWPSLVMTTPHSDALGWRTAPSRTETQLAAPLADRPVGQQLRHLTQVERATHRGNAGQLSPAALSTTSLVSKLVFLGSSAALAAR